jgi:hypothetical protein
LRWLDGLNGVGGFGDYSFGVFGAFCFFLSLSVWWLFALSFLPKARMGGNTDRRWQRASHYGERKNTGFSGSGPTGEFHFLLLKVSSGVLISALDG